MTPASLRRTGAAVVAVLFATALLAADQAGRPLASASFAQLLEEYRRGNATAAVAELARWPEKRLVADAPLPIAKDLDSGALIAHVMLRTEAGLFNHRFGEFVESLRNRPLVGLGYWGLEKAFESYSFHSYKLVEELIERLEESDDDDVREFATSWYVVAMSFCHHAGRRACVRSLREKGESHFEEEADFRLVAGSVQQDTLMNRKRADGMWFSSLQSWMQAPRREFKEALKRDPDLVEARVRLGHVLHVYVNDPDAEAELERALEDAMASKHALGAYLAALFLGELHEDADRLERAAEMYGIAVDVWRAHTASVALGSTLVRLGRRSDGFDEGRLMFGREGPRVDPVPDPYDLYHSAQIWQQDSRLKWMRESARR